MKMKKKTMMIVGALVLVALIIIGSNATLLFDLESENRLFKMKVYGESKPSGFVISPSSRTVDWGDVAHYTDQFELSRWCDSFEVIVDLYLDGDIIDGWYEEIGPIGYSSIYYELDIYTDGLDNVDATYQVETYWRCNYGYPPVSISTATLHVEGEGDPVECVEGYERCCNNPHDCPFEEPDGDVWECDGGQWELKDDCSSSETCNEQTATHAFCEAD